MKKVFPLKNYKLEIPEAPHPGAFGVTRKYDVHTGIDLYCDPNSEVFCIESGEVIAIAPFTGKLAGSLWWNDTSSVMIKGTTGVILYGEITPSAAIKVGQKIKVGTLIGNVTTVLKKDKGRPMTMLHVELYNQEINEGVIWNLGSSKPASLEDPTNLLKSLSI